MEKVILIGVIVLVLVFGIYNLQSIQQIVNNEHDFIMVNELIRCEWSNMGSWIFFHNPLVEDYDESLLFTMSFHGELEGMGSGGIYSSVTQNFMNIVNEQCEQNNLLLKYSYKNGKVVLIYQNGLQIIWEYANKKEPTVLLN